MDFIKDGKLRRWIGCFPYARSIHDALSQLLLLLRGELGRKNPKPGESRTAAEAAFTGLVSETLAGDSRRIGQFGPKPAAMWAAKWPANMVSHPLTMIKSTLPPPFYSIRQADRMGSGIVT
jgi:hypothetical protein